LSEAHQIESNVQESLVDPEKQVSLVSHTSEHSSAGDKSVEATRMSLFEAVRRWTDDEVVSFDIEDGDPTETIQEIAHSEAYNERLLAFDERR
jgi:hypothetical protein